MCGRLTQIRRSNEYAASFEPELRVVIHDDSNAPSWNVAPRTRPLLMHRFDHDELHVERVHWGYRPSWAADRGIPLAINARIEKAATGAFFRALWKSGRAIIPADGWYEWTGEPRHKQPWYIHQKTGEPMFLAAITSHRPGKEEHEGTGFVIVTAAADGGMVDVHDRQPVVFAAADAALWMDNGISAEQAERLARAMSLPPESFEWHAVGKDVNKVGNNHPGLIEPVEI
jgi:putative SOS response-associated peptidase YedK